ncbi:helix-turn-helix domain-containing protein [Thioalkalivibrio sp.]|uniref:helix-turn-helix domain-containing protein n=1 Tax=Thioalkalivibrio sp. TaxID=2093813 RepID=UPI00356A5DE1
MNASTHAVHNHEPAPAGAAPATGSRLSECVRHAMDEYFANLRVEEAGEIYALVMSEVERPLLTCVLEHCRGNQTRAAELLGLNRATLRKKLRAHQLV